jgi:hypothetical protein
MKLNESVARAALASGKVMFCFKRNLLYASLVARPLANKHPSCQSSVLVDTLAGFSIRKGKKKLGRSGPVFILISMLESYRNGYFSYPFCTRKYTIM